MPATKRPTPQDAATARRILLDGLSQEYVTRERRLLDPDDYALAVDDEFAMGEAAERPVLVPSFCCHW